MSTGIHIVNPGPLLTIGLPGEPLVTIEADGTVFVHSEGSDKAAAKAFYDALQIEGQTLFQRIEVLEKENAALVEELTGIAKL